MSDITIMTALIEQHAFGKDYTDRHWRATPGSARKAAEAIVAAGFRMGADAIDQQQNALLQGIEGRLARIEGYMVVPSG